MRQINQIELLKNSTIQRDKLERILQNNHYNKKFISQYYNLFYHDTGEVKFGRKSDRVALCNKNWSVANFTNFKHDKDLKVKVLKKTYRCMDYKFCNNCKRMRQQALITKFAPLLKSKVDDGFYCYHVVLTVPSCTDNDLRETVLKLKKNFSRLKEYWNRNNLKKSYVFDNFYYAGALRAIEITYYYDEEKKQNRYHPHIHALLLTTEQLQNNKYIFNVFSSKDRTFREHYFDLYNKYNKSYPVLQSDKFNMPMADFIEYQSLVDKVVDEATKAENGQKSEFRFFSSLEEFMQKFWRLLWEKDRVTKKDVKNLNSIYQRGFSVTIDEFEYGQYIELFKYVSKGTTQQTDTREAEPMSYQQFKSIYNATLKVQLLATYGELYRADEQDTSKEMDLVSEIWEQSKEYLVRNAKTQRTAVELVEDIAESKGWTIISKNKILATVLADLL